MRRSIVITKATTPAAVDNGAPELAGVSAALSAGSVAVSGAAWNLPATISVQQDGVVGLRQYALNAGAHTIGVSGLPTGVTYNAGLEQLEGASTGTASATVTFTLTLGAITVVDTATVALVSLDYPAGYYPSNYPLELVAPRAVGTAPNALTSPTIAPNIPSNHRCFYAYPGIPYNFRAVVIGGAYPYTFSLSDAPAGMTINAQTGEIDWPDPQATATPTITVTDMNGVQRSSAWTITVSPAPFRFVSASAGSDSNDGSIGSPWQTLSKVFSEGNNNYIVYFRGGTYDNAGISRTNPGMSWERINYPGVPRWIGYPGDSVVIDHGYIAGVDQGAQIRFGDGGDTHGAYLQNLTFQNVRNMLVQLSGGDYMTFRGLHFKDIWEPTDGDNPAGIMLQSWYTVPYPRDYITFQEITSENLAGCGVMKWYSVYKMLVEDCVITDCGFGPDLKAHLPMWEIRGCEMYDWTVAGNLQGINGNMDDNAPGLRTEGEIRFNRIITSQTSGSPKYALDIGQDGDAGVIDVYRNTFVGSVRVRNLLTGDGPVTVDSNVLVNYDGGDGITRDSVTESLLVVSDNLVATPGDGTVDANGILLGSARTTYLNQRGHEIAES